MAKHRPGPDGKADRDDRGDFSHDDGSEYTRVAPDEFPLFDDVDSTLIEVAGAPEPEGPRYYLNR